MQRSLSDRLWREYRSSFGAFALQSVTASERETDSSWSADDEDQSSMRASAIAFVVIGSGAVSSVLAGVSADRVGRTMICLSSCLISGAISLCMGAFLENTTVVLLLGVVWGLSIIADSGQYSAMVAELSDPERVG